MAHAKRQGFWNQTAGVIMLIVGMVLFLSLVSYDPRDVPSWSFFSTVSPANSTLSNIFGIVGALIGGFLYFIFGAAAFFLAVGLAALGAALFRSRRLNLGERLAWMLPLLISGAALFQLQPWFLWSWKEAFKLEGPGGWMGYWVGQRAFAGAFNPTGAFLMMMMVYLASVILVMGLHPILFMRHLVEAMAERRAVANARRAERREQKAREAKLIDPAPVAEKATPRKRKKAEPAPAPEEISLGEPEIFDYAAPKPKKPSLAELDSKRGKKKAEGPLPVSTGEFADFILPGLDLLDPIEESERLPADQQELAATQRLILDTLKEFGIEVKKTGPITKGPSITRFEFYPPTGVRVDKFSALERDLARATAAERINILAPIPGKETVGIEIANRKKIKVTFREILESDDWAETKHRLPIALGKDVYGKTILADLAQMPHCLVAGTTGSGKSVCVNAIVASLLCRYTPRDLRFIMIDPKVVEMQIYNQLPHLYVPVVTDPKKVLAALRWVIYEMEQRYKVFAKCGVRNVAGFNGRPKPKSQAELDAEALAQKNEKAAADAEAGIELAVDPEPSLEGEDEIEPEEAPAMQVPRDDELVIPDHMPYIVVIVDELADLMQTAPADVESAIARITQMARAAGIHMLVATQTPRADVVTGIIKANIPSRIAFQVASKIDSRVILDENGAERLLGQGDMLYLPPGSSKLIRAQGVLVTDDEIKRLVEFCSSQKGPSFDRSIEQKLASAEEGEGEDVTEEEEELIDKCLEIIRQEKRASTSMLQRRLRLGYSRAARVVDVLERRGVLGPKDGVKDREILVDLDTL